MNADGEQTSVGHFEQKRERESLELIVESYIREVKVSGPNRYTVAYYAMAAGMTYDQFLVLIALHDS